MIYLVYVVVSGAFNYYIAQQELFIQQKRYMKWAVSGFVWLFFAFVYYLCVMKFGVQVLGHVYFVIACGGAVLAIFDIMTLQIPNELLIGLSVFSAISLLFNPNAVWLVNLMVFGGCLVLMYVVNKYGNQMIGDGDIFVIGLIALGLGWQQAFSVALIAMVCSGIIGGMLLLFRVVTKKTVIPFVPFIALVQVGLLFI